MANQQPTEKTYLCKYKVSSLIMMMGDKKIVMDPSNILSIEYSNDYELNVRAILKIRLRIDIRQKMWILKNKSNITAKFELNRIGMDNDVEEYNTSTEGIWNCEFGVYFNDEDESIDTHIMEERIDSNESSEYTSSIIDEENLMESQNILDVYLFNQSLLNSSNKVFNAVFTSASLAKCVTRILTETKHKRNVLMSPFENNTIYQELLVPALPAYKAIAYLDQYYGFYKTGALIYYDVDTLYILNTNGKVTAKRKNEWAETTIIVLPFDSSTPGNGMIRRSQEKANYVSISEMDINPQKFSNTSNARVGSEAKIVVTDDISIDTSSADQSFINQRNEFITYRRKDDNKFTSSILKARLEENECLLYISAQNLDISAFTPNKTFNVVFSETIKQEKYGKYRYRLAYAYHYFNIESENFMSSSHRIILKRCGS